MKQLLLTCLLTVTCLLLAAQKQTLPLWPEGIPCVNDLEVEVEMRPERGASIRKVHEPELVAYLPPEEQRNGAAVVICPGGGYTSLAWDWEGIRTAEWLNSIGVSAFILKYRLPHWESEACRDQVALMDAQRAMRLVRSQAASWGVDPGRIGIMGFSAGGHLASTLSTHFDSGNPAAVDAPSRTSCRPDFSILMYPVVTMDTTYAHMGSRRNLIGIDPDPEAVLYFSNEHQVSAETPPTILIHADDDRGVVPENSIGYYLALRRHGVPAALHVFQHGGHGFSMAEGIPNTERWPELVAGWLTEIGVIPSNK